MLLKDGTKNERHGKGGQEVRISFLYFREGEGHESTDVERHDE